jgi:hypothetical protein
MHHVNICWYTEYANVCVQTSIWRSSHDERETDFREP